MSSGLNAQLFNGIPSPISTMLKRSQSLILDDKKCIYNEQRHSTNEELKMAKEKSNKPCEMCSNYEIQLQSMQNGETQLMKQIHEHEQTIKARKDDLRREEAFRAELEEKFAEEARQMEKQITDLQSRFECSTQELAEIRNLLSNYYNEASDKITLLTNQRDKLNREAQRLLAENEYLIGKHIAKSQQLQSETIDLPQNLEDMQFYCLKLREYLIQALVAKEGIEETSRSEILLLKEQNVSEQRSGESIVQNLTQENDSLREKLESARSKLLKNKEKLEEQEKKSVSNDVLIQKNQQSIAKLQQDCTELTTSKLKLEEENASLKNKIQSLQASLETNEQVQKDFVKLSQILQIELEKIRQSENEVRWQHEDDIYDCNNCKKIFSSRKEKHHCSHCGKIFCAECNSKTVHKGPKNRPYKVCDVCHTLLDRETAPYFSNDPPQSPA